jgi:hypothetical protein
MPPGCDNHEPLLYFLHFAYFFAVFIYFLSKYIHPLVPKLLLGNPVEKLQLLVTCRTSENDTKQELRGHRFPSWSLGNSGLNKSVLQ